VGSRAVTPRPERTLRDDELRPSRLPATTGHRTLRRPTWGLRSKHKARSGRRT
jgi:hypothetical protein